MCRNIKQSIIDAAVTLFQQRGYEGTSVQSIVDTACVTKGAFYYYFAAKEDLLVLIHNTFMEYELGILDRIAKDGSGPRDALITLMEEIVVSVEMFGPEMTIFFEQRRFLSDERFAEVLHKRDLFEKGVLDILSKGMAAKVFRQDVAFPRIMAFGIIGMCAWAYQWYRPKGIDARTIGRMYATTVLEGLDAPH